MGLTSNTGLLAAVSHKVTTAASAEKIDLRCEVTPAPFMLRPFAGLYNPFSHNCSVLCNHPADTDAREYVKKAKDDWDHHGKGPRFGEDLSKYHGMCGGDRNRTPRDIVTEDMFRRYTETDSRPHTPAPTLASGKSRGSRRCLTPDQPHTRPALVVDLRRSHSQETIYYHGYTTSDMTVGYGSAITIERSTLPSLNLTEGSSNNRLGRGRCELLPPLASPLVLSKRSLPPKEAAALKAVSKNQLKALNLGKTGKNKSKKEGPGTNRSKGDKEAAHEDNPILDNMDDGAEVRRRGKRRRKGQQGGSDRLTSAGLAAQSQQDPETQIAGIGTDSHNPSSRGSVAPPSECDVIPAGVRAQRARQTHSFLDDDILKYLHREVDEEAIHTEFDTKRRYVLEEALRTRPDRPYGAEMQILLKEMKVPASSLGDWLHIPRVYSRKSAQFSLPIDSYALETLTPMNYAARFVTIKKSKMLLYLTVLRKFRPGGYRMPIESIQEGLSLMMGGILTAQQARRLSGVMEWSSYVEEESCPDDIRLTAAAGSVAGGDAAEPEANTLKYRTWCGVCAICERMFGRFPPRERDPPDGIELSDFTMLETKLPLLKVHSGLVEILNTVRLR